MDLKTANDCLSLLRRGYKELGYGAHPGGYWSSVANFLIKNKLLAIPWPIFKNECEWRHKNTSGNDWCDITLPAAKKCCPSNCPKNSENDTTSKG